MLESVLISLRCLISIKLAGHNLTLDSYGRTNGTGVCHCLASTDHLFTSPTLWLSADTRMGAKLGLATQNLAL